MKTRAGYRPAMSGQLRVTLLDLDGVLVDSTRATTEFFQRLLRESGYSVPSASECASVYHMPAIAALSQLSGVADAQRLAELEGAIARAPYRVELVEPLPEAVSTVRELATLCRIGIVSSRLRTGIQDIVDRFFPPLFGVIVGYEDTSLHKPHPEPILAAMRRLDIRPREAMYVGDSPSDIVAARRCGVMAVGFRFNPPDADAVVGNLAELLPLVRGRC
jgi:HAD superfamily hydrolase (TIGR01509 family)